MWTMNVEMVWMIVASFASVIVGVGAIVDGFRTNRDIASQLRELYAENASNKERIAILETKFDMREGAEEEGDA